MSIVNHKNVTREGEKNRKIILEYISKHRNGVRFKQIQNYLIEIGNRLSRPTIYTHLDELITEKKVLHDKKYGKYFLLDWELGDIYNFARSMKEGCNMMIKPFLIDHSPNDKLPGYTKVPLGSLFVQFYKAVSDISVSKEFCDVKFDKNTLNEKYIFEFANRVGAFITYLLIETARPLLDESEEPVTKETDKGHNITANNKREILSSTLLHRAFEIESISQSFHDILFYKPRLRNTPSNRSLFLKSDQPTYYERNKIYFDRLSNAFRSVYPGIYEALEKKWQYDVSSETDWLEYKEKKGLKCQHSWRETSIYKLGKYRFCIKCKEFVSEEFFMNHLEGKRRS